ncbi:MAG: sporulation protein YunB [Acutalibacteraceae bacterium]|nr:sporulation protein YunB [Acutalibacteraceae bacterium]
MIKRRRNRKYRLIVLTAVVLIVTVLLSVCFYKMHPVIITNAVSVAETIMLNSANEAVVSILEAEDFTYDDIVNLTYNSDGYVTSLEIDIYEVNFLKSKISNEVASIVSGRENYDFGIPIGTFFNNDFTNGLGPKIKFNMQITTTAFVDFSQEFESAGINQVLHIIKVDMKIKGSLVIAGYTKGIETSTSAIAAQTVIVGKTPDAFTSVVESEKDNTGGLINDYGAIAE